MINDVLDLSKIEAGQVQLASGPFSLREALEPGAVVMRERANIERVRIDGTADPAADVVEGDARRIHGRSVGCTQKSLTGADRTLR